MGACASEVVSLEPDSYSKKSKTIPSHRDPEFEQLDEIINEIRKNNIGWCNHRLSSLSERLNTEQYRYILRHIRLINVLYTNISSDIVSFMRPFVPLLDVEYIENNRKKFHLVLMHHPAMVKMFLENNLVTERFLIYRIKKGYDIFSIEEDFRLIINQGLFPDELFASDFHYFDRDISVEIMTLIFNYSFLAKNTLFSQLFNYNEIRLVTFYDVFKANETLSTEILTKKSSKGRSVLSKFMESKNITKSLVEDGMVSADLFMREQLYADPLFYRQIRVFLDHWTIPEVSLPELLKIGNVKLAVMYCSIDDLIDYLDFFGETIKNTVLPQSLINVLPRMVRRTDISIGFKLGLLEKEEYVSKEFVESIIPYNFYLLSDRVVKCDAHYYKIQFHGEFGECVMNRCVRYTAIYYKCKEVVRLNKNGRYLPGNLYGKTYEVCYTPFQRPTSKKYARKSSELETNVERLDWF